MCSCKVGLSAAKGATDTYDHLAELAKELNKKGKVRGGSWLVWCLGVGPDAVQRPTELLWCVHDTRPFV